MSKEKINEMINAHFDKTCDICGADLDSYLVAQRHYLKEHKVRDGYLKCCNIKLKTHRTVLDHVHWHDDPETFKYFFAIPWKRGTHLV